MTDEIPWVLLIASAITWGGPRLFFLRDNKELSGEELAVINPSFAWIGKRYPFLTILWCSVGALIAAGTIWFKDSGIQIYRLAAALGAYFSVVDALIAIRTGVYPMPSKGGYHYVYEDGVRLRRIGLYQLAFAIAVTAATIISVFL
jgi:hypothetical protein